jgi:hypothetical protein
MVDLQGLRQLDAADRATSVLVSKKLRMARGRQVVEVGQLDRATDLSGAVFAPQVKPIFELRGFVEVASVLDLLAAGGASDSDSGLFHHDQHIVHNRRREMTMR